MARGVNKVILIGNLGRDPELTYTPSGLAVARFTLATSENRKNSEGEWESQTEWHNVVLFGKTAEAAGQYLSKGKQVYIEGRIQTRKYEKDGVQRYYTEIIGNIMNMLGKRDDSGRQDTDSDEPPEPGQPSAGDTPGENYEDDLPF